MERSTNVNNLTLNKLLKNDHVNSKDVWRFMERVFRVVLKLEWSRYLIRLS